MPGGARQDRGKRNSTLWSRLGWFVLIWLLSIGALGIVAYAIRLMIP
ncbi:DUF2474 domain-containing protein [Roseovarius arcticus]|nr:DUF2474 domain-containing protein [Roseovarius arcticus]